MQGPTQGRSVGTDFVADQTPRSRRRREYPPCWSRQFRALGRKRIPDRIEVYTLPETIVDIVPQYRGFRYIVAENELIIVDPDTLEIVAVLPV
jgi:uncharacterized protein DUF1236